MKKYWEILLPAIPILLILVAVFGGKTVKVPSLGIKVTDLGKARAAQMGFPYKTGMVLVGNVKKPARASGIMPGDVILGINAKRVESVVQFLKALQSELSKRGQDGKLPDLVITLNRNGHPMVVTLPSEWVEAVLRGL